VRGGGNVYFFQSEEMAYGEKREFWTKRKQNYQTGYKILKRNFSLTPRLQND
jgi:hypothetical protein